jgi:5' nucleotidase, deoxy (Pyrimidine), cytosolic type C protein (NT5C)
VDPVRSILASDVDSTVWNTGARVREVVLETTGDMLDLEAVSTWTDLLDAYGEATTTEIFDRVLSPERVGEREPYPGSSEVLRRLQEERGIGVHFICRNHDPGALTPRLEPWLREHFGPGVRLTVTTTDKLDVLWELGAFGLIDDRPEILERAADAGLWAMAKIQPWNRELVAARPDVHGFCDWREVPDLLPVL